jgi:transposase InsO family protein
MPDLTLDSPIDNPVSEQSSPVTSPTDAQLSLHAMSGFPTPNTFRILGTIAKRQLTILVDSGSTQNFIQDRVAKYLGLPVTPAPQPFKVMVGNGNTLDCTSRCVNVPFSIQGNKFVADFFLLSLGGAEVVLGVPWLVSLGPILMDYTTLQMQFTYLGRPIELKADAPFKPKDISVPQMKRCVATHSISLFLHLQHIPDPPSNPISDPPIIQTLLSRYQSLFDQPSSLPPLRSHDHRIHLLPDATPVNVRPYRYPYYQKAEIEKKISEMLQSGMIRPSRSPFSSPVLLVKKKDGSWRCCIDYRALNSITVKDRFPMPTIDELLDDLGSASWFSKLDLRQGFHQIRMHDDDIPKTTFRTHQGHYEYRVMPFGLCNAPSTFQAAMNELLQPFLRHFVAVFFDDILVYSVSLEEHVLHLDQVFSSLLSAQFYLKQSKCLFAQRKLEYLGHIISGEGVQVDPSKISAMVDWPVPTSTTSLRGFLGLTGFYRKFIRNYAAIATPLTKLLRKDAFLWTAEAQTAFESLKQAMTKAPLLASPNFSIPFVLETDASGIAMGAVLMQNNHPIAFFSKPFCQRLLNSSTYVRELHAITTAVKKWRQYLLGHKFIIFTDHKSLKQLISQVIQTPEQQVYLSKLLGFDFTIQYKAGNTNVVADALSRIQPPASCLLLTVPHFVFLNELKTQLSNNQEFQQLKLKIAQQPASHIEYQEHQDLIFFKEKIWLPRDFPLKDRILNEFHNSPVSGHMGVDKTFHRLQANFFWQGMRQDIRKYIAQCSVCQSTKYETKKPGGLLQPLPVPSGIWEDLSLDFITGLPPSHGCITILVVVDRFSKGAHFGALPPTYTAYKVAQLFLDMVCKHHGVPRSLVSDRDPIFISQFWRELFKLSGTQLRMSTAYHPETDGQTEVLNRSLEQYLRAFVHHKPSLWLTFLPLAEWSYNTTKHSATGYSPFHVMYGKEPTTIPQYVLGTSPIEAVDSMLAER